VGDIPYSEALKGETHSVKYPKYDTQKEVFLGILNELDKSDKHFAEGSKFEGDPIYDGDVDKWQKLANTFELKVLINLYKKTGDSDLKVKQRFKKIVNNRPIFKSNSDNFQLTFHDEEGQRYPWYKEGNNFLQYAMVSSFLINHLKNLDDRRLFYYAAPSPVQVKNGKKANDSSAYKGTDVAEDFDKIKKTAASGDFSNLNARYSELPKGIPYVLMSYGQINFILAEAAVRGWISGSGKNYYEKGIKAAMNFTAKNTPDKSDYNHDKPITDSYTDSYIQSSKVSFASAFKDQLKQIELQKYLMNFMQNGYLAYFEYRRTGYPKFPINPETNLNPHEKNKMPVRWKYPQDELDHNSKHVQKAIDRQYGGDESYNDKMWILKNK
jgi:hypothetical protein